MKKQIIYLRDRQGCYLCFNENCGGYFSHSLKPEGAIAFKSYLLAMTFAMGYNSIAGLDDDDKVTPFIETLNLFKSL